MVNVDSARPPQGWSQKPTLQAFTRWPSDCEPQACRRQNQPRAFHCL